MQPEDTDQVLCYASRHHSSLESQLFGVGMPGVGAAAASQKIEEQLANWHVRHLFVYLI